MHVRAMIRGAPPGRSSLRPRQSTGRTVDDASVRERMRKPTRNPSDSAGRKRSILIALSIVTGTFGVAALLGAGLAAEVRHVVAVDASRWRDSLLPTLLEIRAIPDVTRVLAEPGPIDAVTQYPDSVKLTVVLNESCLKEDLRRATKRSQASISRQKLFTITATVRCSDEALPVTQEVALPSDPDATSSEYAQTSNS
jgi:hypothetical protein